MENYSNSDDKTTDKVTSKADIEKKLNKAVEHVVPDIKDRILEECNASNFRYAPMPLKKRKYSKIAAYKIILAAAVIFLIFNLSFIGFKANYESSIATIIDIDVNPSIELKINNQDRVVKVIALNSDALEIIEAMELTGADTNVAVNALLGSMLSHGYLADDTRTILVSVNSKDQNKEQKISNSIANDIGIMLDSYSVEARVVSQPMELDNSNVSTIADEYEISNGKAAFVQKIVEADPEFFVEDLTEMSVTELDNIWDEVGNDEEIIQVVTTGINYSESSNSLVDSEEVNVDFTSDILDNENAFETDVNNNDDNSNCNGIYDDSNTVSIDSISRNVISDINISSNGISTNSISENSASENSISENIISENSVSVNSTSENAISENSISKNSISKNSISKNSISKNSISKNNVSKNSVSKNSLSKNSVSKNNTLKNSSTK